jgi:polyvinyl alcohol dehydrogenase (cytochrome)
MPGEDNDVGFEGFPTVARGIVYLAGKDGTVYALDASTGHKKWSQQAGYSVVDFGLGPIAVADGFVYGCTEAGEVYALDGASGNKQWSHHTKDPTDGSRGGHIDFAPRVANGLVYVVVSLDILEAIQPFA